MDTRIRRTRGLGNGSGSVKYSNGEYLESLLIKNPKLHQKVKLLSDYTGYGNPIIIEGDYGPVSVRPETLYILKDIPSINKAVDKTSFLKNMLKEINPMYEKSFNIVGEYTGMGTSILIEDKYGILKTTPKTLLKKVRNGKEYTITSAINKQEYILSKFKSKFGDKYDYSEVLYVDNETKVKIKCPHGHVFWQRPNDHLDSEICPVCFKETSGYSRESFIERSKNRESTCYIIECFDKEEHFYKIGITSLDVHLRFEGTSKLPYDYKVIHEMYGSPGWVWDKEKELHRINKQNKYKTLKHFSGETECFSKLEEGTI